MRMVEAVVQKGRRSTRKWFRNDFIISRTRPGGRRFLQFRAVGQAARLARTVAAVAVVQVVVGSTTTTTTTITAAVVSYMSSSRATVGSNGKMLLLLLMR